MFTSTRGKTGYLYVACAVFMIAWGGNHFTPLLHLYEVLEGFHPWQANLLLGTYVGGLIPGLLLLGPLSDQHGRKPVLIAGTVISIFASLLLALDSHSLLLLCLGRLMSGVGVGAAMSVGSSWIKELSSHPFDTHAGPTAGAKRSSLTLTLGFGLGAAVSGAMAQWAPMPEQAPYFIHLVLSLVALAFLLRAQESLAPAQRTEGAWYKDLRIPSASHHRFRKVIIPTAPWIFAAAGVAYAIIPAAVQDRLGTWSTLYATVLTVLTLGTGALSQNLVPWIAKITGGRALPVGMTLMTIGMLLSVLVAWVDTPVLALCAAVLLGAAYGICTVAGLIQVQTIATAQDLAGLSGLYYSLAYSGFLLPTLLATLLPLMSYAVSLALVAAVCGICAIYCARSLRIPNAT
ncbi:MFS transporter [Glutamicibacter arilaitensis]|uniref:MFS superfamily transporter n=1 Tax=Glutamicibacter arilaitensis (strain DSM 16368 / CIP 108037 / IAM 15318 / JCM 13566 / NCIMB 14258 / Re117) TaxID=861360 RepID=A0ABP1U1C4_GLUAR|nr:MULTISPECIES: MFS transporter [Glutamicibacter]CBT75187.1 putative MFS superfamily transporter [Glutamicibacter arilaitensis Re117]